MKNFIKSIFTLQIIEHIKTIIRVKKTIKTMEKNLEVCKKNINTCQNPRHLNNARNRYMNLETGIEFAKARLHRLVTFKELA